MISKTTIKKIALVLLEVFIIKSILLTAVFIVFNWPVEKMNSDMKFGTSFSHIFARDIGLDWQKTFIAMLDELKVKRVRLAAYWTEIEREPGTYDFSYLDWQLAEAEKRNTEVVLAMGVKAPRWPECFIPEFYGGNKEYEEKQNLSDEEKKALKVKREQALLAFEQKIVDRYKHYDNIKIWQVENEPFLPFGDCIEGAVDADILDREIQQLKNLDSTKPIMVTDSGELSIWYRAAKRGDIFGTTLYRVIHKPPFGYVEYPVSPNFFRIKGWFIQTFARQENIMISELQGEPWGPGWLPNLSLEEQAKSMNPGKFREIVRYAQRTGFSECYLWGIEWWYWMKDKHGNEEMWDEAKFLFSQEQ